MKRNLFFALVVIVAAIGMTSCEGGGNVNGVKFRKMNLTGVNTLALASRGQKVTIMVDVAGDNKGKARVYKAGDTTAGQVISVMVRLN